MTAGTGHSSRFGLGSQNFFAKQKKKYWNSRVFAGYFVMECEKIVVLGIYKKVMKKSAVSQIVKDLRLKSGSWQPCLCDMFIETNYGK